MYGTVQNAHVRYEYEYGMCFSKWFTFSVMCEVLYNLKLIIENKTKQTNLKLILNYMLLPVQPENLYQVVTNFLLYY